MPIENMIEVAVWIISIFLLYLFVPKGKYREAQVSFLFMQTLTWVSGAIVVELKLIAYPVRFFPYAFQTSFTFEYLAFPAVSVLFNLYFPKTGSHTKKALYVIIFPSVLTAIELLLETYTKTIEYIHWNWFLSWSTMFIALLLSYWYYTWFFAKYEVTTTKKKTDTYTY